MTSYKISTKAKQDVKNIWNYTAENWSVRQANNYVKLILDEFVKISKNTTIGKNYSRTRNDYFGSQVQSHIIFYRIVDISEIEIIRVLHKKIDLRTRIGE